MMQDKERHKGVNCGRVALSASNITHDGLAFRDPNRMKRSVRCVKHERSTDQ